ncbi:hypothetical protein C9374_002457 [Naegleria lovaniensis]|uniref:Gamma-butyrobetaine hydroxylase-like N-terminal domain-containing protein n=1 Tax=Naegleria lovaniensis TaxID=51637 RepID=A0AA88GVI2_NAELO|nr:uncharacterized protein C9374_002457 [Naegleria lovaniensis]KAG2386713.1 hypothetical protein C9374_002457 [Naegleria lovaniensis]
MLSNHLLRSGFKSNTGLAIHKLLMSYHPHQQLLCSPVNTSSFVEPFTNQIHNFSIKLRWHSNTNQEEDRTAKTTSSNRDPSNRTENLSNIRETFHHYASTIPSHLVRESTLPHHHQQHVIDKPLDPKHPYGPDQVKVQEIKLRKQRKQLELHFEITRSMIIMNNNGEEGSQSSTLDLVGTLPAELLRVESPSAEVQGENGQKRLIYGKKFVQILQIETVGSYAIRIIFSDGHDSGIYSWSYLYEMAQRKYSLMKQYIKDLRAAGKSRYPREYLKKMKDQQQPSSSKNE